MYARILVPLDGSERAEQVLPYVRILAKGLEAKIELLQVFDPPFMEVLAASGGGDPLSVKRREAREYLESAATRLREDGLDASPNCCDEEPFPLLPASCILSEAEKVPSTLIAMSTHGRSGIGRWLVGSTTDKVLQAATSPLLVVESREEPRHSQEVRLESIMVPLDGSSLAEQVLPDVVSVSRALSMGVVLLRVTPGLRHDDPHVARQEEPRKPDPEAVAYLNEVARKLREDGVSSVKELAEYGEAAAVIIDTGQEIPGCLMAMSSHGRSGIGRWYLGSVADRVVRHARLPVLITRASKS